MIPQQESKPSAVQPTLKNPPARRIRREAVVEDKPIGKVPEDHGSKPKTPPKAAVKDDASTSDK